MKINGVIEIFERKSDHKRYKIMSRDGFGLELKIPRYEKTNIKIGTKSEAEEKGLRPRGSKNFYETIDKNIVVDGYLAVPAEDNKVEIRIRGAATVSKAHWEEIKKEIDFLFNYQE